MILSLTPAPARGAADRALAQIDQHICGEHDAASPHQGEADLDARKRPHPAIGHEAKRGQRHGEPQVVEPEPDRGEARLCQLRKDVKRECRERERRPAEQVHVRVHRAQRVILRDTHAKAERHAGDQINNGELDQTRGH